MLAVDRARHVKQKRVEQQGVRPVGGRPPARGKTLDTDHERTAHRVRGLRRRNDHRVLGTFADGPFVPWGQVDPAGAPPVPLLAGE